MAFSVKASNSPQLSPGMHPYVSPQMLPHATGRLPPFSLSDGSGTAGVHAPPAAKRSGTDPTKYKTSICRNWQQGGLCTFRGCTFAHGVEELRVPTRSEATPTVHPQHASLPSVATPPLAAGTNLKIEQLLEMLYAEVIRERELVNVHIEANRTLEGMLRREQAQHEETRALLLEKRTQYMELAALVEDRTAQLQVLARSSSADEAAKERVAEFLARASDGYAVGKALEGDSDSNIVGGISPNGHDDDEDRMDGAAIATDDKEEESARIAELLRALQQ